MTTDHGVAVILRVAGVLHFTQLPAMLAAGRMLGWRTDLAKLTVLNRRIVQVIGLAIVIVMCGLGVVVIAAADQIAQGGRLATAISGFLAVFIGFRAYVQWVLYKDIWPSDFLGRLTHWGLGLLFSFLTLAYVGAWAHATLFAG